MDLSIPEKLLLNIKSNLELLKSNPLKTKNEVNQNLILNLSALYSFKANVAENNNKMNISNSIDISRTSITNVFENVMNRQHVEKKVNAKEEEEKKESENGGVKREEEIKEDKQEDLGDISVFNPEEDTYLQKNKLDLSKSLPVFENDFNDKSIFGNYDDVESIQEEGKASVFGGISIIDLIDKKQQKDLKQISVIKIKDKEDSLNSTKLNNTRGSNNSNNKVSFEYILSRINGQLTEKQLASYLSDMCGEYVIAIYDVYSKIKTFATKHKESEDLIQINKFKELILDIGISEKKFYEHCIREIIYNKNTLRFSEFIKCFHSILYLKFDQNFIKYKFLFYISPKKNEEFVESDDLDKFYEIIGPKSQKIYDQELFNNIKTKFTEMYKYLYPNDDRLVFKKMTLVLERFFDLGGRE